MSELPAAVAETARARDTTLFASVVGVLNAAGVLWVFALMFLISADITARTAFDDPIAGVTEMVSLSLVGCVFLQLAHEREGRHARADDDQELDGPDRDREDAFDAGKLITGPRTDEIWPRTEN